MTKTTHIIYPGMTKGRLTVISEAPRKKGYVQWLVKCECGVEKSMYAQQLYGPRDMSCGCFGREQRIKANTSHGHNSSTQRSGEYESWWAANQRCSNPNNVAYQNYGGRGIVVCERWRAPDGFPAFLADMGPKPTPKHSIDRYPNNDGNYEPGNCRWATVHEQRRKHRKTHWVEYRGERVCLTELAMRVGISPSCLRWRLLHSKLTVDEALAKPYKSTLS